MKEKRKVIFQFFKKYFFASLLIMTALMFLHAPNVFFKGTTIEYVVKLIDGGFYLNIFSFFAGFILFALLFVPVLIFAKVRFVGWIPVAIFSIFTGLEKYIFYVQGENTPWNIAFNEDMLNNFMVNPTGLEDSFKTYSGDMHFWLYLFVFPTLVFISIMIVVRFLPKMKKHDLYYHIKAGALAMIVLSPSFFGVGNDVPYMYRVHYTIFMKVTDTLYELGGISRQEPYFKNIVKNDVPKNIVFIMDESVRGDLVSMNNPYDEKVMKATPFLYSLKDKFVNFGNLYSASNCSYPSNELTMAGFNVKNMTIVPNYLKITPTIFQYMQNAGYKTHLLDNVHSGLYMVLKNYDRQYIDQIHNDFKKYQEIDGFKRDRVSLDELRSILNNGDKNFIYIVKYGIHFPYENAFDKKDPLFKDFGKDSPEKEFNLYMNALHESVDDYWKKLIDVVGVTDTVVLWQSDHSVNITSNQHTENIRITHCEQGLTYYQELHSIPGVLYSPNEKWYEGFKNLENGYSSNHMFPTMLEFAGYDEKEYSSIYGTSFKNPNKLVEVRNVLDFYKFGDINTSNVYDLVDVPVMNDIHPLNKRRILPNTLPDREFIIKKEVKEEK